MQIPFASSQLIVVVRFLLDANIGQVRFQILNVVIVVRLMGQSCEAISIQPHRQLTVVRAKDIYSQIELLPSQQQRVL